MYFPKVSVIIPIFNVGHFLRPCLDSILNQTFKEFEILLVDDGSTDNSGAICDDYARKDNRIHVVHKSNGGVSSARNTGIQLSKSEWLYFVDADDEIISNGLETLYNATSPQIDLVCASYIRKENDVIITERESFSNLSLSREQFIDEISKFRTKTFDRYLWCKLFRKSIIKENALSFDENLAYREDVVFLYRYASKCKQKISCLCDQVYVYNRRSEGAAMTYVSQYSPKSKGMFYAIIECIETLKKDNILLPLTNRILKKELIYSYKRIRHLIKKQDVNNGRDDLNELKILLNSHVSNKEILKYELKSMLKPLYRLKRKIRFLIHNHK